MATLNIEGVGRVTVDDSFLKLSPEAQAKTVEEIVASARGSQSAPKEAPTQESAPKPSRLEMLKEEGKKVLKRTDDLVRGVADTLTFGYADEIAAGLDRLTGINTGKQGGPAPKNYEEALASQRARDAEGGTARTVGQIGGAFIPVVKGAQLAKSGLQKLGMAGSAPAVGAITGGTGASLYASGSSEGDIGDRAFDAALAFPVGATVGAVAPVVVDKAIKGGSRVVDKAKELAGVQTPVEKLSPAAQTVLREQADVATDAVTPKAARAIEKLSENPQAVASDLRVRDLFLTEKRNVLAADPQRAIPDDVVFKNVGDKLKRSANQTVDALVKAGDVDAASAKELKAVVSRAARHNRAITGQLTDAQLADEFAKGFRTDDAIIDALNIPKTAKETLKTAIQDLDTVTFNSLKKNQGGIFEAGGALIGNRLGSLVGVPGVGRTVGGGAGRIADQLLMQQGTAPVLRRNVERLAQGLDEAGIKAGDTVGSLEDLAKQAMARSSAKRAQDEAARIQKLAEEAALRNKTIQETAAIRQSQGKMGRPVSGAYKTFLDETQLTNEQAIPILRKLSKDFEGTEIAKAATELRRSSNVKNETAFYALQDTVRDILGGADTKELAQVAKSVAIKGNPASKAIYALPDEQVAQLLGRNTDTLGQSISSAKGYLTTRATRALETYKKDPTKVTEADVNLLKALDLVK